MIQKEVVPWAQIRIGFQEGPDLIEGRFSCSTHITDTHWLSDRSHQLCVRSLHDNFVFHRQFSLQRCGMRLRFSAASMRIMAYALLSLADVEKSSSRLQLSGASA